MLLSCGVRYLGFPLRLPVHQPDLKEHQARTIIKNLAPPCYGVLITYLNQAEDIIAFCRFLGTTIVQLHGEIDVPELQKIKQRQPDLKIIKSLVIGLFSEDQLLRIIEQTSPYVDAFITDTYDVETGAAGATGKIHDWNISRRFVLESPRPVILAGGLTPENVREAVLTVKPAGVDAHTGVEDASGRKSREKVCAFVTEAQHAFRIAGESAL